MKPHPLLTLLFLASLAGAAWAGPRDALWVEVDEAQGKRLPKTAIERLEKIIPGALADRAYPEAIRAISRKIALEGELQGGRAETKIASMDAELQKAPAAMKPMMEAILAHWYWQYFQQNRWRTLGRTQTTSAPGTDITTWDLPRILSEVDRHFSTALANEAVLKSISIRDFDELLDEGNVPLAYRPTVFDFLAYEALAFHQAAENRLTAAEDQFEIDAAGPIFGDAVAFSSWKPEASSNDSSLLKAIHLYQSLLTFHARDADRSAFLDADLARIIFGYNTAVGESKDERYKAALERFINAHAGHEISARARARLATKWFEEGNPANAHAMAQRGIQAFPGSAGAAMCEAVVQQIEARSAQLHTEQVWNKPWPTLDVTYRNVTTVHFRALSLDFAEHLSQMRWSPTSLDRDHIQRLLAAKPVLEWSAALPATTDYKERTEKIPAPTTLRPGFYIIVASHDRSFTLDDNLVALAPVWVSDLALVRRSRHDDGAQSGLVMNALTGEPISGATVRLWQRDRNGFFRPITSRQTDTKGLFEFSSGEAGIIAMAEYNGHAVATLSDDTAYRTRGSEEADTKTVFFTDRAIYRPGQTIHYKGISIRFDQAGGKYSAIAGLPITVVFNDPNGKEIARATHTTNDYGSTSGTFTAPRDRVTGHMSLQVLGRPSSTSISVEEYKRPKFQVQISPPSEAARLGARATLPGKATSYTGAAIGGANVVWRVERRAQLPFWFWWWQPQGSKAIAHGKAVTAPDGTFKIEFTADPDRAIPEKNEPIFSFSVHADVTDTTGETRSSERTVRVGYTALKASLQADEWQTPERQVELQVRTQSLDGDPLAASGTIRLHLLVQPAKVARAALQGVVNPWRSSRVDPPVDPSNPNTWDLGRVAGEKSFTSDSTGNARVAFALEAGIYRAILETKDRLGKKVTAQLNVHVVAPRSEKFNVKVPDHFTAKNWTAEPGQTFTALWGTGYDTGRAFIELEREGKMLKSYWTDGKRTQSLIELPVTEQMRGGFTVRVTSVRENRAYLNERIVSVPWSNKQLTVKWESFRSKLVPGQPETWTAIVTGPDAKRASAEMVAALYDASLDQFQPHDWPRRFDVFRSEWLRNQARFHNAYVGFSATSFWRPHEGRYAPWQYRSFRPEIINPRGGNEVLMLSPFAVSGAADAGYAAASTVAGARGLMAMQDRAESVSKVESATVAEPPPRPDLATVATRQNLNETAFFLPQLVTDGAGAVKISFTIPEALTEWKFLGFAHDQQLRSGFFGDKVVTAKDLMVEPNPPRFVREGDAVEFTVKVSNQSDRPQAGRVRLTFADAASLESANEALGLRAPEQAFDLPAKQSRSFSWRITIPDTMGFLTFKAVAATSSLSDGEEGYLPVLSRRILVTESLPLPIRGPGSKPFAFKKLLDSESSPTLQHQSLTVQMTSQPAWYAVLALPYLMEFPHECSEQVFNRLYANALARHVANSDPKIRRIFDAWKGTPALDSPLEKNQNLKAVMIEETPWVRQATEESQRRRNIGILFEGERLEKESAQTLADLAERQLSDGLWPWFPGGRSSEYISLYIVTGFGRIRHLGVELNMEVPLKAITSLDAWMEKNYRDILARPNPDDYIPSYTDALYLYGRSFFLETRPIGEKQRAAIDFFLDKARRFWTKIDSRQSHGHLALALQRFGDKPTALAIAKSLKERSVDDNEMGMFWRDPEFSWWWYRAPIETQALMIEVFAEVAEDAAAVEDCKVWLLKQKQTQDWRTTKATADAIYALLLRGQAMLSSDAIVSVSLGGQVVDPGKIEPGTGYYERSFQAHDIRASMGDITVTKVDGGVSWGSVHWQYLEDIARITPHEGTPLSLKKALFVKETTSRGQVLRAMSGPLAVGDELVVRIELRTDRDMEFVHLKDQRGSGTEPVNVLSRYRYQDGLAYYESTKDTASHFFIDYLPRGTYVFEYSTRVQLRGTYQSGIAEIQCMYAPEFNSHSASVSLEVK